MFLANEGLPWQRLIFGAVCDNMISLESHWAETERFTKYLDQIQNLYVQKLNVLQSRLRSDTERYRIGGNIELNFLDKQ